jgi:hypothetical protein
MVADASYFRCISSPWACCSKPGCTAVITAHSIEPSAMELQEVAAVSFTERVHQGPI